MNWCMHVLLTSGILCWRSSESGSASVTGVEDSSILSTEGEVKSRLGLPGMIPADLAARSIAPERVLTRGEHEGFVSSDKHRKMFEDQGAEAIWGSVKQTGSV